MHIVTTLVVALMVVSCVAHAADPATKPSRGLIAELDWMVGEWTIDATWTAGNPLKARARYESVLGGKFLQADTFVSDGKGGEYHRYRSVFGNGPDGTLTQWGFAYDGSQRTDACRLVDGRLLIEWTAGAAGAGVAMKQSVEKLDGDRFRWQVWMRDPSKPDGDWQPLMDGTWVRVTAK
jgi:hypothetical protein